MRASIVVKSTNVPRCQFIIQAVFSQHLWEMCQLSEPLCPQTHTHKNNILHYHKSIANSTAAISKIIILSFLISDLSYPQITRFILASWLAPGVSSLLIGLNQSSAPADWSKSKWWFPWFVLFQSSGEARWLNHLTGADYHPSWARQIGSIKSVISRISCFE